MGFDWTIGFIDTFFKISLSHNKLQQLTVSDCLRLAPIWLDYDFPTVTDLVLIYEWLLTKDEWIRSEKKKTPGLSPPANYTDRATAAFRRS
jgi:hypothetical protein